MTGRRQAPALIWRVRLVAMCLGLAAFAFRQSSGLIVPDTKLDLTANPGGFLARSLHLWDPQGAFGQLQNQAYGYLFPVGPFHYVLGAAGVPGWVVQRLWWTTILTVAFLGMWRLSRAFGVTNPWLRLTVGVAYALSPRMIAEVAVTSVELWPMAMAPWVLLPLVVPGRTLTWRAGWSGVAVALVGGVNAVATGAVLVLPALWLLTRRWNRRLARLALAWLGAVAAACAWWLVPLVLLGGFSPPFLSWIEDAATTTSTASVFQAFRGTSAWLGFLAGPTGPSWPAGWAYAVTGLLVVATTLAAALGIVGLARWRHRDAGFLLLGVTVGLLLLTAGHVGPGASFGAEAVQHLLDGVLAPMRNTHKFDLVVRLPLAIGLGLLLERVSAWLDQPAGPGVPRGLLPVLVGSLVVMLAAPGIGGSMARAEGYRAIPDYWRAAAGWLDAQPTQGAVLVTPGASFSDLNWGSPKDEPLQALSRRPFVVRDAVPLGSAGATRLLDSIEDRLGEGQAVDGLDAVLRRVGIAYVLVRNDLRLDAQANPPLAVHRALVESGLRKVVGFGPLSGAVGESESLTVDYRTLVQRDALEIYAVPAPTVARMVPEASLVTAAGGPENLLGLTASLGARDLLLTGDTAGTTVTGAATPQVLTDGLRRREVDFGRVAHNTSALLESNDPGRAGRRSMDYAADGAERRGYLDWAGIASVTASSSASDATATLRTGPANGPQAALDGDLGTRWVSGSYGTAVGEWLQVDFARPTPVSGTTATFSAQWPILARPAVVTVATEHGSATTRVFAGPGQRLVTPPGPTRWLRVTLAETERGAANGFSIAELAVPGVSPRPTMVLPPSSGDADLIRFEEGARGRSGCLELDGVSRCSPTLALEPEETGFSRTWSATRAREFALSGTVRPRDGAALESLLALPGGWSATASSRLVSAPNGRPDAGIDGDPATGWVASPTDPAPWFDVDLGERRRVTGLRIVKSFDLPASTPRTVHVRLDDGPIVTATADENGEIVLPAATASRLRLTFGDVRLLENIDSRTGVHSFAPIGFSELVVRGAEDLARPLDPALATGVPCGFGPEVWMNGRRQLTAVSGTVGDLLSGHSLAWHACGERPRLDQSDGSNRLDAVASAEFVPTSLTLIGSDADLAPGRSTTLGLTRPDPAQARLEVPARDTSSVLVLAQNFNRGWVAHGADGQVLAPIRVDGWQQGWVLPAGPAVTVAAQFGPDVEYRLSLLVGALLLLGLVAVALRARRSERAERAERDEEARRADRTAPSAASVRTGGPTRAWLAVALGLVVVGGGTLGVLAVLLAAALVWWSRGRGRLARRAVSAVPLVLAVAAAGWVARTPWPASDAGWSSGPAQGAIWLAVSLSLAEAFSMAGRPPSALRRRGE